MTDPRFTGRSVLGSKLRSLMGRDGLSVFLLQGGRGVGKSSILTNLAVSVVERGLNVELASVSMAATGADPLQPIWELLEASLSAVLEVQPQLNLADLRGIDLLVDRLPRLQSSVPLVRREQPPTLAHLRAAMVRLVVYLASQRPLVWLLDDLHAAAPEALQVLTLLVAALEPAATLPMMDISTHSTLASSTHSSIDGSAHVSPTRRGGTRPTPASSPPSLLLIAACRSLDDKASEIASNPFSSSLLKWKQRLAEELRVRPVTPLSRKNIIHMLEDVLPEWALERPADDSLRRSHSNTSSSSGDESESQQPRRATSPRLKQLAKVMEQTTRGHALSMVHLIRLLQDLSILPKAASVEGGFWNVGQIQALPIAAATDAGCAEKLVQMRFRALPAHVQAVLCLANAYGSPVFGVSALDCLLRPRLDFGDLVWPVLESRAQVQDLLDYAARMGFLVSVGRHYRFSHAIVQETAQAVLDAGARARLHLCMGRRLQSIWSNHETSKPLLSRAVTQFNKAASSMVLSTRDRLELSALNQRLAETEEWLAKAHYLQQARELLGNKAWETQPAHMLSISMALVEQNARCGRSADDAPRPNTPLSKGPMPAVRSLETEILRKKPSMDHKRRIYDAEVLAAWQAGRSKEALRLVLTALADVHGERLPVPPPKSIDPMLQTTYALLGKHNLSEYPQHCRKLEQCHLVDCLGRLADIARLAHAEYAFLAYLRLAQLSVERGQCYASTPHALLVFASLMLQRGQAAVAGKVARVAMSLLSLNDQATIERQATAASATVVYYSQIVHVCSGTDGQSCLKLREVCQTMAFTAEPDAVFMGVISAMWAGLTNGTALADVRHDLDSCRKQLSGCGTQYSRWLQPYLALVDCLAGGEAAMTVEFGPEATDEGDVFCRMLVAYLDRNLDTAHVLLARLDKFPRPLLTRTPVELFFLGMVVWAVSMLPTLSVEQTMELYQKGDLITEHLQKLVDSGAEHGRHWLLLLQAEDACRRPSSTGVSAIANAYDDGIAASQTVGDRLAAGLGCERAGIFFDDNQQGRWAMIKVRRALVAYERMGAVGRIEALRRRYGLRIPSSSAESLEKVVSSSMDGQESVD